MTTRPSWSLNYDMIKTLRRHHRKQNLSGLTVIFITKLFEKETAKSLNNGKTQINWTQQNKAEDSIWRPWRLITKVLQLMATELLGNSSTKTSLEIFIIHENASEMQLMKFNKTLSEGARWCQTKR